MAKIEVSRTELVWPGKYDADGSARPIPRLMLPFQTIETAHERRLKRPAEKEKPLSLFDVYTGEEGSTFEDGWKNKLIWGDNLLVMSALLQNFAGKVDLIYMDPPFATEANFSMNVQVGTTGEDFTKPPSIIEEKAYNDTWGRGRDSWFIMMYDRLRLARELLSDNGTLYLHLDWYVGHHVRPVLAEIFGEDQCLGEIIWSYGSPSGGRSAGAKLVKAHDTIFIVCKKHGHHTFNRMYLPYTERYIKDWFKFDDPEKGKYRKRWRRDKAGNSYVEKQYLCDSKGMPASTVWSDIQQLYADPRAYLPGMTSELTGYPTQKPEALLTRIIEISSNPGDLVADFFSGSGTTLVAAEKAGRRWIGCELGRWGVHVTRKRLLETENCRPFQLLNLGRYERQHWQGVTFDSGSESTSGKDREEAMYEYIAFVLKLYRSEPVTGFKYIHGRRGGGGYMYM